MEGRLRGGPHPGIVFALAAAFALSRIGGFGLTFDEARIVEDARGLGLWMLGLAETGDVWFGAERPSPAKVLALLGMLAHGGLPEGIRLLPAILYAAAVAVVYATLRRPFGAGALAAAMALVVTPPISGHAAQCSNEIVVTSFLLLALARAAVARTKREWFWVGAWIGLACGTKVTGVVGAVAVAGWAWRGAPPDSGAGRGLRWAVLGGLVAYLVTWPVLPLAPGAVGEHVLRFATLDRPPLVFFGIIPEAPWYYALTWLVLGLPPLIVVAGAWELVRGEGPWTRLMAWFTVSSLVAGVAAAPWLREGTRHLLPLVAVLMVAAGLGAARLAGAFRSGGASWRGPAAVLLVAIAGLEPTLRLHPAEVGYISPVAGGAAGAVRRGLPITSSGDVLNDEVWRSVPAGPVALIPGAATDRPLYFGSVAWRRLAGERATAASGRSVMLVPVDQAERLIVLGPAHDRGSGARSLGRPLLERDGIVYVAWLPHPARLSPGVMESAADLSGAIRRLAGPGEETAAARVVAVDTAASRR